MGVGGLVDARAVEGRDALSWWTLGYILSCLSICWGFLSYAIMIISYTSQKEMRLLFPENLKSKLRRLISLGLWIKLQGVSLIHMEASMGHVQHDIFQDLPLNYRMGFLGVKNVWWSFFNKLRLVFCHLLLGTCISHLR